MVSVNILTKIHSNMRLLFVLLREHDEYSIFARNSEVLFTNVRRTANATRTVIAMQSKVVEVNHRKKRSFGIMGAVS